MNKRKGFSIFNHGVGNITTNNGENIAVEQFNFLVNHTTGLHHSNVQLYMQNSLQTQRNYFISVAY